MNIIYILHATCDSLKMMEKTFSVLFIPTCITLFVQNYVLFVDTRHTKPTNIPSFCLSAHQHDKLASTMGMAKREKLIFDLCLCLHENRRMSYQKSFYTKKPHIRAIIQT